MLYGTGLVRMLLRTTRLGIAPFLIVHLAAVASIAQTDPQVILDGMVEELGGDAYRSVTDVVADGRYYEFQRGVLTGIDVFRDYLKFPDKERTEFGEKEKLIRINNGDRGWNITDDVIEPQIPEQINLFWQEYKVSLDHLLRVVLPESAATLQFIGRDMVDFNRVDILEIRDEDRTRINLYVDRNNRLLVKKSVRRLDDPQVHEEVYSNYHELDGVLTPLLVSRYTDGVKTMEIHFETVRYNTGLSDDLFVAQED